MDLSYPDNFFNSLSLIKSQGKKAVGDALIISFYDGNPINGRTNGFRTFHEVSGQEGIYWSPFKQWRGPNWEMRCWKSVKYDLNGRIIYRIVEVK
ncbi:hypothetical protein C900_00220 [Fulvivirga imtechensis AK7]|uniref:Uncharacterized protein n=1 Tax=Fulvivirga imtechensis AK7 TaxID=1237149 RepID=L8JID9_9BACT|nr:hypothetical protein C900_00220 [Fulvivirga imtechensis AK7]